MLTKKTPETVKGIGTVKCAGDVSPLNLTFYNRTTDDLSSFMDTNITNAMPEGTKNPVAWVNAQVCLYIIKSFDDGTDTDFPLTLDGMLSMEAYYPNVLMGIIQLFHTARMAAVEKN